METESPSHRPKANVFQFRLVFFETPQATGPWSLVSPTFHVSLNNLKSYLLMFNSYILLVINIDTMFRWLVIERDALLKSNQNIYGEKQDLEASINQLRAANEKDSKTIQELK